MNFEQTRREVQDTLVGMADIERYQAEVQKLQAEGFALHEERMEHIETTLSEVGDKLNGLIGFMDNFVRRPQ